MDALDDLPGTVLADTWRLGPLLGAGGMGAVFAATHEISGEHAALKIVLPDKLDDGGSLLPRFLREARLASRIHHPHVVRVVSTGRWGPDRDRYYLAMEKVDGLSLGDLVDAPLSEGAIVGIACQILEALGHVHARNILHRDVKPDNVLVARDAGGALHCKVTDFGIAAAVGEATSTRLTQEGAAIGTPAYMAPEQAMAVTLDAPQVDLYGVGVLLFRMVTGRLPFEGSLTRVMFAKVTEDPPEPLRRDGSALPAPLAAAIRKLMARKPEHRYGFAADALVDLRPLAEPPTLDDAGWREAGGRGERAHGAPNELGSAPTLAVAGFVAPPPDEILWGREPDFAALEALAAEAEEGVGRVAVVFGAPGIGKSRLVESFAVGLAESGRFRVLRSSFHAAAGGLESLRAGVDRLFGTGGRSREQVADVVREFLRQAGDDDEAEAAELVAFLRPAATDVIDGAAARGRRFALILRLLRRIARQRPVLVVVDDVHAGGSDSAAFIEYVLFEADFEPLPLLFLATSRVGARAREFSEGFGRSDRFEGQGRRTLQLGPIPTWAMVEGLVRDRGLPRAEATTIAARSDGNPLFAQHLQEGDAETLPTSPRTVTGSSTELPSSLRRVLEASLQEKFSEARDPDALRDVLLRLAVLGSRADVELLEGMLEGEPAAAAVDDHLDALLDFGLIEELASGRSELLAFTQGLMRDALLGGASRRRLRKLHRRAAEVRKGHDAEAMAGLIGEHLAAAGEDAEAISWWLRGMGREVAAGDVGRGARWGQQALDAMGAEDPRAVATATELGRLHLDAADLDAAIAALEPVLQGRDVDAAMVAGDVLGEVFENRGDGERWRSVLDRMEALEEDASPVGRRALGRARSLWLNTQVAPIEGRAAAEASLVGATPGLETQRGAQRLAFACMLSGDATASEAAARLSLKHAGDSPAMRARSLRTLALALGSGGKLDEAIALAREELALVRRTGQQARVPIALADLGFALGAADDFAGARAQFEESLRTARRLGMEGTARYAEFQVITVDLADGRTEGIEEAVNRYTATAVESGITLVALARQPVLAWLAANEGRADDAVALLRELDFMRGYPVFHHVGHCLEGVGRRLMGLPGANAEAVVVLREAAAFWDRASNPFQAARCRGYLERIEAP